VLLSPRLCTHLPFCRVFNDDVAVAGLLALMSIF
jgi:hypothetical protein